MKYRAFLGILMALLPGAAYAWGIGFNDNKLLNWFVVGSGAPAPAGTYSPENATDNYTAEDAVSPYVTEH